MIHVILALDLDGVLRRSSSPKFRFDSDCLQRFEEAIQGFPEVRIVITSTWKDIMSLEKVRGLFSESVRPVILGFTSTLERQYEEWQRFHELTAWLKEHTPEARYVVIDDQREHYPPSTPIILCDPESGFDEQAVEALKKRLSAIRE